jgi:hypothetical protein
MHLAFPARRHAWTGPLLVFLAATIAPGLGCGVGGDVKYSISNYEVGHYNDAAQSCWDMGGREDEMNDKAHVRYLVYCGLTQYKLGRRREAQRMLALGSEEYTRGRASWLKPGIVDEMLKALDDLEGRTKADRKPAEVLSGAIDPAAPAAE